MRCLIFISFLLIISCAPKEVDTKKKLVSSCYNTVSFDWVNSFMKDSSSFNYNFSDDYTIPQLLYRDFFDIINSGELRVVLQNNPTSYYIYRGYPYGFEYEISKKIADYFELDLIIILVQNKAEAIQLINYGYADLIAFDLTLTKQELKEELKYSIPLYTVHQVLVQRKPDNWFSLSSNELNNKLIKSVVDLKDKTIHIENKPSYFNRLNNLSEEIGGEILVKKNNVLSEILIQNVIDQKIEFTVANDNIANLYARNHSILDVSTAVSFDQNIVWATNKESLNWLLELNVCLNKLKSSAYIAILYNKYFKNKRFIKYELNYFNDSILKNKISKYDILIKSQAKKIDWDWRLLAALVYTESGFNNNSESWVGAKGLMQLMPETAIWMGVHDSFNPSQNICGGVNYLAFLSRFWNKRLPDSINHQPFIIASYNVGQGHVEDALRLAKYYNEKDVSWNTVRNYLMKKSYSKYYKNPVVKYGYCRGKEPISYVAKVDYIYQRYQDLVPQ